MGAKNKKAKRATSKIHSRHHTLKKWLLIVFGAILFILIIIYASFKLSPWPGALVIRAVFNHGSSQTLKAMEAKLPDYPVKVMSNQHYRTHDKDALLDIYIPKQALRKQKTLPTVVWTHGGAWLSGDKADAAPYFKRLANEGFVVVSLNYSLAPEKTYPTPVYQLNDAYKYLQVKAKQYHLNPDKIVLAGDSAGAQLSSQMAAIITNPAYAKKLNVKPSLKPSQLAGTVLFCGIYKVEKLEEPPPSLPKLIDWGNNVTVWAYTGKHETQNINANPLLRQMSAYYHVNKDFPPSFISGGNADPLTKGQSIPLAHKLQSLNVPVKTLFFTANHEPRLPHEYQFTFNSDGEKAFAETTRFLKSITN